MRRRWQNVKGLHAHRLKRSAGNPEERRFANAWKYANVSGNTLGHLLNKGEYESPNTWDAAVAATVVQWLGSPVGRSFLRDLGYEKVGKPNGT